MKKPIYTFIECQIFCLLVYVNVIYCLKRGKRMKYSTINVHIVENKIQRIFNNMYDMAIYL